MANGRIFVDASALIYLAKADAFDDAHVSVGTMLALPAVWQEAVEAGIKRGVPDAEVISGAWRAGWVEKVAIPSRVERAAHELAARHRIGEGESEVLAMAEQGSRVVIDDLRATRVAIALGFLPIPTVFVPIVGARERGLPRRRAVEMLRRLASVVTLSAGHMARLETLLGERR